MKRAFFITFVPLYVLLLGEILIHSLFYSFVNISRKHFCEGYKVLAYSLTFYEIRGFLVSVLLILLNFLLPCLYILLFTFNNLYTSFLFYPLFLLECYFYRLSTMYYFVTTQKFILFKYLVNKVIERSTIM